MSEMELIYVAVCAIVGLIIGLITREWSKGAKLITIIVTLAIYVFLPYLININSNNNSIRSGDKLVDIGTEFVSSRLKSPSTAVFHGFVRSEFIRKKAQEEWGMILPSNCDIVVIDVEATNGLGGRNRTNYAVFFKNGQPIEMIDASELDYNKLRRAISMLGYND